MNRILCIDNSGSTRDFTAYWDKVSQIYQQCKPTKLIFWNDSAEVKTKFEQYSTGGTEPQSFIALLKRETVPYNLIITTDGEIYDADIQVSSRHVTPQMMSLINSTVIYYVGSETSMNIGLNVIFGRTKKMSYHINDQNYDSLYETFDMLAIDDLMSPNFAISLIVKIKNIEAIYPDKSTRKNKISELRGAICKLYSKLEHESLDGSFEDKLEMYFKNNEMKKFIDILGQDRLNVMAVSQQKSATLSIFAKKIYFNISRIRAATTIQEQAIEVKSEEDNAWSEFEDVITLDKFNLPCLLVQNIDEPLITDNIVLKHPMKLLSEPDIIKQILNLIEPNPIDYTTYQKLAFDSRGYTVSPYTRVSCKGVFVLDIADMKCVKNNCRTISVLFGDQNKVPGNLILWNLVIMYLLYKYKFYDTEYKNVILDQIIAYCKKFKTSLSFSHQCQVLRPARIEICLWYCIHAAPTICPNTSKNILRSPFGLELLQFYLDTFGLDQNEYLQDLTHRTRKWAVWNYLVVNKGTRDLDLEVRAQYQNYIIHKDRIILLSGKCEVPYKSKCNIVDADSVNTMFANLTNGSSKIDNIDNFEPIKAHINYDNVEGVCPSLTHVKINIKTCWPHVICPITKLHWRECVGAYDVKTGSHVRIFNTFCAKYKMYPANHMDLVWFFSKRNRDIILKSRVISNFEYVYDLFEEVMKTYTCRDYISIYNSHTDEKLRLSMEC